jgi:hypothetical protein
MSTELTVQDMEALWKTAAHVSRSSFAPQELRGKQEEVFAALLTGSELGLGPMASLRHISIIDGKPSLSAAMQLALLRRAGHTIQVEEQSATRCAIVARSPAGEEMHVEYTAAEAKAAGLLSKTNWQKYPADMLWARCVSRLARRVDAGATLGIYSPADWDAHDTKTLAPEEYAAVVSPAPAPVEEAPVLEAGELPLRPEDEEMRPILVSCPRCGEKVSTGQLAGHLENEHD